MVVAAVRYACAMHVVHNALAMAAASSRIVRRLEKLACSCALQVLRFASRGPLSLRSPSAGGNATHRAIPRKGDAHARNANATIGDNIVHREGAEIAKKALHTF